jgi:peptidoglycan/LPS O-acetylase OafA/YrhL
MSAIVFRLGLVLQDPGNVVPALFLTPGRLDGLMTGAALAVVARMPGGLARLKALAPRVLGSALLAVAALAIMRGGLDPRDPVVVVAALPAIVMVYGALLAVAVTGPSGGRLIRTLRTGWLGKWGKYSYGIYVIHYPLLGAIEWKTSWFQHRVAWLGGSRLPSVLLLAAVAMSMSYALAWLSYHLYEKRVLELKRYFPRQSVPRPTAIALPTYDGVRPPLDSPADT